MKNKLLAFQVFALTTIVVSALFLWQGNKGFNLWDEGFLWYGVQRVMQGEVPIRDFMAYDPGRYYLSAALMAIWGDGGIIALRGASAIFQGIGLFVGLWLIATKVKERNLFFLLLSALTLAVWMFPYYKVIDHSASILLIGALAFLVQSPTQKRYFFLGLCIGLAAFFGRNHAVYGVLGSVGVMLWLNIKRVDGPELRKGFVLWSAGVIAGFLPILSMLWFVPGFAVTFWEGIRLMFEVKATNQPLPVPWPWGVDFSLPFMEVIQKILLGLFFLAIVLFGVLSIGFVTWQKYRNMQVSPALVAASFLALPYANYAYSRADFYHLALGIFPLMVGGLVALAVQPPKIKWPLAFLLCASSVWSMYAYYPGWQCDVGKQCVSIEVSNHSLQVDPDVASDVKLLRELATQYASDGQSFIATPFWPGAYSLLDRKSPMWEIYALFSRSEAFEKTEIERIKKAKPGFALVFDHALDGQDEWRFKNTHPLIHRYIVANFKRLDDASNSAYQIYASRDNSGLEYKPLYLEKNNVYSARAEASWRKLKIINWGPQSTTLGVVPNPQPGGSAGIWIQVSGDAEIGEVQVMFDGQPAKSTSAAPGLITAAISVDSIASLGAKKISIKQAGTKSIAPVGDFNVNAR